jgi:hypothetical protein
VRCFCWWSLGSGVAPSHTAVNDEIGTVDEAALVAGKEYDGLRLLHGLAESAGGEVHFAAVAFGRIVAEPVLEEGCAARYNMLNVARRHVYDLLQWRRA